MDDQTAKFNRFQDQLKAVFEEYDYNGDGTLDADEIHVFVDDIRSALYLDPCEEEQFRQMWEILDRDNSGGVDWEEFSTYMPKIFPILSEPSNTMMKKIIAIYHDFDIDGSGYWEKDEWTLFLKLMCDKLGVARCEDWQIDYIISVFDLDNDYLVSLEEFQMNYRVLGSILLQNKKLNKKKFLRAVTNSDIIDFPLGKRTGKIHEASTNNETGMPSLMEDLAYWVREYQRQDLADREAKKKGKQAPEFFRRGTELDSINNWNRVLSTVRIPIDKMITPKATPLQSQQTLPANVGLGEAREKRPGSQIRTKSGPKNVDIVLGPGEDFSYDDDTSIRSRPRSSAQSHVSERKRGKKKFERQPSDLDRFTVSPGQYELESPQMMP
jgi:Ca2+-binding EF-hand superfamily protein